MKSKSFLAALILIAFFGKAQNIASVNYVSANANNNKLVKQTSDSDVSRFDASQAISINVANLNGVVATVKALFNNSNKTVNATSSGFTITPLSTAEIGSYSSYKISITTPDGSSITYDNVAKPNGNSVPHILSSNTFPSTSVIQELLTQFPKIEITEFGLVVKESSIPNYLYIGDKYSHIFLDQFGNSLLGAIPQGISNRQYIVCIIYLTNSAKPSQISYSVKQTKGSFNPTLLFNNAGQLSNLRTEGTSSSQGIAYTWTHQEFLLRTATDDIEFEVSRNILDENGLLNIQSSLVAKHTIQMSQVFHGSFDVGLLSTHLQNPTFQLVPSINNPNQQVVKQSENGNRGVITAMATLYTSPIILLEKYLFRVNNIPNYKLTGRNFLDDHKIYERIFPAIGVSLTDKTFENLFFGANWEIARGASVFVGCHYGKVNVFNTDQNFKFEETVINESEFNLRNSRRWKTGFSFGANLDILIITNLLRR